MSDESFKKISGDMAGRSGWGSSLIIVIVIALIASLSTWSTYAELDNVARGEGRIISPIQNQSVQAGEGGIILRRYVSENSSVAKGDLLFEIDPIDASSELNQMSKRFAGLEIRERHSIHGLVILGTLLLRRVSEGLDSTRFRFLRL